MRVIYVDILLFLNFYITYFLVIGLGCIFHRKIPISRRILSSLIGAVSSLVILLPELSFFFNFLLRLFISSIIVFVSVGFQNIKVFIKNIFAFFAVNCLYAGVMLLIWMFFAPMGMVYNNWVSYFDLPLWLMILSTSITYLFLIFVRRILDSKSKLDKKYELTIITKKGSITLSAIADTGNKLTDFLSGAPVIFCNLTKCAKICPNEIIQYIYCDKFDNDCLNGVRLIPCSTVAGNSLACCFKPDKIIINDETTKKEVNALIGFTKNNAINNEYDAIFNPNII